MKKTNRLQEKANASDQAEEEMRRFNETLEKRVAERTAELHNSERQFRLLVAGVTDYAIYMLGLQGHIVSWNAGAERIKGYSSTEIIGKHFSQFYTLEDQQNGLPAKSLATALQTGRYAAEGWRVRKDGSRFWASVVIDAIPDESGQLVGFAKITRDITERKQLEEQLRQSQKMDAIGQLTGGVAHDFNNLLIIILGNLETLRRQLDQGYTTRQLEVAPGQYVVLAITDTGFGMTREVMDQAFEPFFTTKDVGHGTGLGLSQVYGFVKQSGGHVKIYSEVGQGTTVRIYLPRMLVEHDEKDEPAPAAEEPKAAGPLMETILVVEDDDDVRAHSTDILKELGYRVLETPNGRAALEILGREPRVKLLFTDVVLPGGMNGRQLAQEARRSRPGLKVLYTTGYAKNAITHDGRLDPGVHLITKPFTYAALATKVRGLLERDGPQRVLVVEDMPQVRMVAVDMLETLGFRVEEAASATEATNLVRVVGNRIDAAIIDIGLPDGRGDTLAAELRAMYADLPIIITTGYGEADVRSLSEDGLVRFLTKPYDTQQLEAELRGLGLEPAGTAFDKQPQ